MKRGHVQWGRLLNQGIYFLPFLWGWNAHYDGSFFEKTRVHKSPFYDVKILFYFLVSRAQW
jgi:hypothetical protein